jgi:hypothetical protein
VRPTGKSLLVFKLLKLGDQPAPEVFRGLSSQVWSLPFFRARSRKVGRIEVVLTGNPDQREQGIAAGVGEGGSQPMGRAVSLTHSPEAWTRVVVSLIRLLS